MRIAVLCSGNGSNFENIVRTCRSDEVVLMIHNKKKCGAAKRADKLGIPHSYLESTDEINMIRLIQAWNVDLVVLAGWMRIITKDFIDAFRGRIINVHPSLLPKYKGLRAIEQAMEAGEMEMRQIDVLWVCAASAPVAKWGEAEETIVRALESFSVPIDIANG